VFLCITLVTLGVSVGQFEFEFNLNLNTLIAFVYRMARMHAFWCVFNQKAVIEYKPLKRLQDSNDALCHNIKHSDPDNGKITVDCCTL